MATFVRTTGGLLQLKAKPLSRVDQQRIARLARKIGVAGMNGTPLAHGQMAAVGVAESEKEPVDLQASRPEAFR